MGLNSIEELRKAGRVVPREQFGELPPRTVILWDYEAAGPGVKPPVEVILKTAPEQVTERAETAR